MVGYFIGDAPHVGSIHAIVNRIWSVLGAEVKIDVQFISKTTVLFRIENEAVCQKVLRRRYWHVSDVPLVVNVWTPETAASPPDLTAMPLWVDLKSVPSYLFSHKGLKCVSSQVRKFVKLHPFTERCTRLDMAQLLLEVNLKEPLVEKLTFTDRDGAKVDVEVCFPWLPTRCNICSRRGHKGSMCTSKQIVVLQNTEEGSEEGSQGAAGSPAQVPDVVIEADNTKMVSPVGALLAELEAFPVSNKQNVEGTGKGSVDVVDVEDGLEKVGSKKGESAENEGLMEEWKEIPH